MSKYEFTPEMGEISGFGGGYEQCCQKMLIAALEWFDDNPDKDPKYKGHKQVFGLVLEDNDDAKELTATIIKASENEATGAMHHAVVNSALWIQAHSWEEWVRLKIEKQKKRAGG